MADWLGTVSDTECRVAFGIGTVIAVAMAGYAFARYLQRRRPVHDAA